jgi:DNA-binding NarL/FixJ family response regulator
MSTQDTTRRLSPQTINQDVTSLHGLQTINTYNTTRADASEANLQLTYQAMLTQQQTENEKLALYRAAADAARLAEWEFHNAVLAMKEVVRGQYGSDSDQAQSVGLKKKSDRKRPTRKKSVAAAS